MVALDLRNAADYRLPSFKPHGTKLGHSWFQWKTTSDVVGWFDNSEKEDVSGQLEHLPVWSRGCTPPQERCRLPASYFWITWHQTRAFLISMKNKKWFSAWFDNSKKGEVSGQLERLPGYYRGCTPPQEHRQLPPTYFWTSWHQPRAFLISVKNENLNGLLDNSEKGDMSGQMEHLRGWPCGCTPPQQHCGLPPTFFSAT